MLKIAHPSFRLANQAAALMALLSLVSAPLYSQDAATASQDVPEVDDTPPPAAQTKAAPPKIELKPMPHLQVTVEGLEPEAGSVEVSVFNSTESFMVKPFRQESGIPNAEGKYQIRFVNMPEGEYGIVVVHDVNGNARYDAGFLGFGAEPVGYSNDARPWLGRPAFEAVSFEVEESLEVTINMQ